MELIEKRLPDTHQIVVGGDWHIGSVLSSDEGIDEMIEYVKKTPDTYFAGLGDYQEAITVDDFRYDMKTQSGFDPLEQTYAVQDKLSTIKDKVLALGTGNHEAKLMRYGDLVKDVLCRNLEVPYGTFEYKLIIKSLTGALLYKIFITHGFGSISTVADSRRRCDSNIKLSLERKLRNKASDCVVMCMGHTHKLIIAEPIDILNLIDDGKDIHAEYTEKIQKGKDIPWEHRYYINTGSFMRLYKVGVSGYASIAGYDPVDLGYPVIKVVDGKITGIEKRIIT